MLNLSLYDCLQASDCELKSALGWTDKNWLYLPGDNPILLVAHIDTLPRKGIKLVQKHNIITNKYGLLGADDRAGVYAALYLHHIYRCPVLLTDYEETGGQGARDAVKEFIPAKHTALLVELDRKGANEYVTYTDQPGSIHKYVQSFGYVEEWGSFSDISILSPAWGIPAVNLSIGYYHQHTKEERLHVDEMQLTIDRVSFMLGDPPKKVAMPRNNFCELCGRSAKTKLVKGEMLCKECQSYCLY